MATTLTRAHRALLSTYRYVFCRTMGHDWEEWHTDHQPEFGYYESVQCPRCTTERLFTISLLGDVISRRYIYPEGYKLGFAVNRSEFRREMRKQGWWDPSARKAAVSTTVKRRAPRKTTTKPAARKTAPKKTSRKVSA